MSHSRYYSQNHAIPLQHCFPFKLCKALDYSLYKSDAPTNSDEEPLPDDDGKDDGGETPDSAA